MLEPKELLQPLIKQKKSDGLNPIDPENQQNSKIKKSSHHVLFFIINIP